MIALEVDLGLGGLKSGCVGRVLCGTGIPQEVAYSLGWGWRRRRGWAMAMEMVMVMAMVTVMAMAMAMAMMMVLCRAGDGGS